MGEEVGTDAASHLCRLCWEYRAQYENLSESEPHGRHPAEDGNGGAGFSSNGVLPGFHHIQRHIKLPYHEG